MNSSERVLIIGAGPTGLGAALALEKAKHPHWTLLEASHQPGGLASSVIDPEGFIWDLGGHVLFSHYDHFDRLMEELLKDQWVDHRRESWIWMRQRFIPYPLQNNIRYLPPRDVWRSLSGLLRRKKKVETSHFESWLRSNFGEGLYEIFLKPYNRKVWAHELSHLGSTWVGERVAIPTLSKILRNIVLHEDDQNWGPNATFRFPAKGGTGAIWQALYNQLPSQNIHFGKSVTSINLAERWVVCGDGERYPYDRLLSSMPLDQLVSRLIARPDLAPLAASFKHSSTHVIGFGFDGQPPESLKTKCWIYFPESAFPFYRLTVFSNYAASNVRTPGRQWSVMVEVSESPQKPVDRFTVVADSLSALRDTGFIPSDAALRSTFHRRLEYGYPTPFLGRDEILEPLDAALRAVNIWSRGRFGAWKYEVSNQDHSLMQGVEAVNHWMSGSDETTYVSPARANSGRRASPSKP